MGGEDGAEEITANSPGRVDCITPRGEKEKEGGAEESREPGWGETEWCARSESEDIDFWHFCLAPDLSDSSISFCNHFPKLRS